MTTVRSRVAAAAACVLAAILSAGCTYSVRVENRSDHAVTVRLVQTDPLIPDWILAAERIDPGRAARFGPQRVNFSYVVLEAEQPDRSLEPARIDIDAGGSTVAVVTETHNGTERLAFRKIENP